jgi:ubiquinone/menaquinone biosynthesis C-methylase UbiE
MLYAGVSLKELKDIVTNFAKVIAIDCEQGNLKQAAQKLRCSERILQMHKKIDFPDKSFMRVV